MTADTLNALAALGSEGCAGQQLTVERAAKGDTVVRHLEHSFL